jgi:hypothetical protein
LFFQTLTASVQGQEMCIRELTGCSTWSRSLHPQQIIDEWAEAGGVLQPVLTWHFKAVDSISWLDTSKQLTASLRWGKHCLQVVSIVCTQCKLTNFKTQLRILWWMPACIHAGLNPLCARWWTGGALPPSLKDTGRVRSLKLTTLEKLFYLPYRFNVFFA